MSNCLNDERSAIIVIIDRLDEVLELLQAKIGRRRRRNGSPWRGRRTRR
jgi:hypothetical protein